MSDPIVDWALAYPFARPGHDYVLLPEGARRLVSFDPKDIGRGDVEADAGTTSLAQCAPRSIECGWTATIASGSNAGVAQLQRKFHDLLDGHGVIVLEGRLEGFVCVYSAHIAAYGSVPATLWPIEGADTNIACVLVPNALMPRLHETENIGVSYGFFALKGAEFRHETHKLDQVLHAYLSFHGGLVLEDTLIAQAGRDVHGADALPRMTQPEVLEAVRERMGYESVSAFVHAVVGDGDRREREIARLHGLSRPMPLESFERVA